MASDVVVKVTPRSERSALTPCRLSPSALELYLIGLPVPTLIWARGGHRKFCVGSLTSDWAFRHLGTECFLDAEVPWKPLS